MIVLDSDHLRVLRIPSNASKRLEARLVADGRPVATTIINVHEGLNGWLDVINKTRHAIDKVQPYAMLHQVIAYYADWIVLPFDEAAANRFDEFRPIVRRLGTMDLQIASIVVSRNATLLTANSQDFGKVPGLSHENWLINASEEQFG
jgi:tRNA(fMet)-specific endonuclease VapC